MPRKEIQATLVMKSVRARFIAMFIFVTTLTLGAFGVYAQYALSGELEARFTQMKESTIARLTLNLPGPLFNFDLESIEQVIRSEVLPLEVSAIYVLNSQDKVMKGVVRGTDNVMRPSTSRDGAQGVPITADIYRPGTVTAEEHNLAEGKVAVYFTREPIERALKADIFRRVGEVLAVDVLLVLVLTFSLRMFFGPLAQLRDALFDLASHEIDDAEELPDAQTVEFSEVINGFNQTQRKLKQVIQRRSQAEVEARDAALKTEQALSLLKSTQHELVETGKLAALGRLVAGVAHQLNTPLSNGIMAITTLRDRAQEFKASSAEKGVSRSRFEALMVTLDDTTELALRSLERCASLVTSFKQIAGDPTASHRTDFHLDELINETVTILQPILDGTPYTIEHRIDPGLVLDSYAGALEQVLAHIMTNAVVHAFVGRDQGVISIRAHAGATGQVILRISDNGIGVQDSDLAHIFDPFFTTRLGYGSSGLGLNIVYNTVVQILGGTVEASSRVGVGTEFTLVLPTRAPDHSTKPV